MSDLCLGNPSLVLIGYHCFMLISASVVYKTPAGACNKFYNSLFIVSEHNMTSLVSKIMDIGPELLQLFIILGRVRFIETQCTYAVDKIRL